MLHLHWLCESKFDSLCFGNMQNATLYQKQEIKIFLDPDRFPSLWCLSFATFKLTVDGTRTTAWAAQQKAPKTG